MQDHPPIEKLKLQLIEERHTNWKYLNKETLTVSAFFVLIPFTLLMVVLPETSGIWVLSISLAVFLIFMIAMGVSYRRYSFIKDHKVIGNLVLDGLLAEATEAGLKTKIDLQNAVIQLKYGFVRGVNQFRMHDVDNGISELRINNRSLKFIVYNYDQSESLSKLLGYWYSQEVQLSEITRDVNEYKLVKLDRDFDWKEWKDIEANNKKRASKLH